MELLLKYWGVIVPIIVILWHGITNFFEFKGFKKKLEVQESQIAGQRKDIDTLISSLTTTPNLIKGELMAYAAEQDKLLALKIADQERRNAEATSSQTKLYSSVEKQLELMNQTMLGLDKTLNIVSSRTESIERNEYQKVLKELEAYKAKHGE